MSNQTSEGSVGGNRLLDAKPLFTIPVELRRNYLNSRRGELEALTSSAKGNEWKFVVVIAQHVRGTGGMYGFPNIGDAAENLCRAIQAAEPNCMEYVDKYAAAVNEAYI